ncbi:ribosomal RNA small subunit methyltransferase NEP1 [Brevipalpus obovatus]|uniref:ribosomal RNA small subunit methyltransferase NEP1 n=1 Tax=Brevipalpus obovatus TaxID=246614 RepID=UPI003D9EE920
MSQKRSYEDDRTHSDEGESDTELPEQGSVDDLHGEKIAKNKIVRPKLFKDAKNHSQRLIVVLERANLEIVKVGTNFELLNCDDHMNQIRKYKKDPAFCRPDITHQCLLMLFDSPLNRAGLLQVYIHTMQNVLIEINPATRFPRTFKRWANLMVQLLHKLHIRAASGSERLLKVIKNPITSHLPVGCRKVGTSFQSKNLIKCSELVPDDKKPFVVVIGAMAHGQVDADYVEETVSFSQYPLSAALACTKIVSAFEESWGVH